MFQRLLAALLAFLAFSVFAAVDANKGSAADLDGIKGIGPALSGKIVEARKGSAFKDWADLISRVSGIGETSAAKLSEAGLTVNGQSYKGAAPAAKAEKPAKAEKAEMAGAAEKKADATAKPADKAADKKAAKEEKAAAKKAAKADAAASAPKK